MKLIFVIIAVVLGILVSAMGISILGGKMELIPAFHRKRVTEADRAPFCKLMGAGMLIIGLSFIVFAVFAFLTLKTQAMLYTIIGAVIVGVAVVVGLGISYYAMFKYNKGMF